MSHCECCSGQTYDGYKCRGISIGRHADAVERNHKALVESVKQGRRPPANKIERRKARALQERHRFLLRQVEARQPGVRAFNRVRQEEAALRWVLTTVLGLEVPDRECSTDLQKEGTSNGG